MLRADNLPDHLFRVFDASSQPKLYKRTLQVVIRITRLKVAITGQIIGKEAQAQFKGDQTNRVIDISIIGCRKKVRGFG